MYYSACLDSWCILSSNCSASNCSASRNISANRIYITGMNSGRMQRGWRRGISAEIYLGARKSRDTRIDLYKMINLGAREGAQTTSNRGKFSPDRKSTYMFLRDGEYNRNPREVL